ncbi:dihydropteroate synthase [Phaeospirillum tilakii]|uniref:dihydropteroate synthase n=1 Tax=Phaeospirillum tilakii TaxID=741673 RepID=A0ABW5CAE9_9PROT
MGAVPAVASAFQRCPVLPRGFALAGLDLARALYLLPAGIVAGEQGAAAVIAGQGWPIADGPLVFTAVAVVLRSPEGGAHVTLAPFSAVLDWAEVESPEVSRHIADTLRRIGRRRDPWAGLALDAPLVMGIVNVTPDSFSDGGDFVDPDAAIAHGLALARAGATILDVGGESTRPGAAPVAPEEEERRVLPVVRALAERGLVVSIDTRHARVMDSAVAAGARIINDVTALTGDPDSLRVAAASGAALCLMHMQGDDPRTMQADPHYDCAPLDVADHLAERIAAAEAAGIDRARICLDPGIGFGKTTEHNAQVLAALPLLHGFGCPLLLGVSRKRFIAALSADEPPRQRLPGTLAANLAGLDAGVQILRVHDVAETCQALRVWQGMRGGA